MSNRVGTREGISKAAGSSDVPFIDRAGHPNSRH